MKISYNAAYLRILAQVSCGYIRKTESIPEEIYKRAKQRLDDEVERLTISDYVIFREHAEALWRKVKEKPPELLSDDFIINFTLANGFPFLDGIIVEPFSDEKHVCSLTIKSSKLALRKARRQAFISLVRQMIKEAGIKEQPSETHLLYVYQQALKGKSVRKLPILKAPSFQLRKGTGNAPYICLSHNNDDFFELVVFNVSAFMKEKTFDDLFFYLQKKCDELGGETKFKIMEEMIHSEITEALSNVQSVGLYLPLSIYAVKKRVSETDLDKNNLSQEVSAEKIDDDIKLPDSYPGKGLLKIFVSEDNSEAKIINFRTSFYAEHKSALTDTWLQYESMRLGLVPLKGLMLNRLMLKVNMEKDLNGEILCKSSLPEAPEYPYIKRIKIDDGIFKDLRSMQMHAFVEKGQKVACIAYEKEGKMGSDVYGHVIPIPEAPPFDVDIGPGIEMVDGDFLATETGILQIENNRIEISKTYYHSGDVNLVSGNIEFDGPIVIDGSIDTGSRVYSTGDIMVTKDILSGYVVCGGDLVVEGGIVTGDKGYVKCSGNIKSEFIEHSVIYCGKNLEVVKSLVGSKVYVGKNIILEKPASVVAGGAIFVWGTLRSGNIGYKGGNPTHIYIGCNWRHDRNLITQKNRLEQILKAYDAEKQEFREHLRKVKINPSEKLKEQKDRSDKRAKRLKALMDLLEMRIHDLLLSIPFNIDSCVQVMGEFANCNLYVQSKKVETPKYIKSIAIKVKSNKEAKIMDLEEFVQREKEKKLAEKKS